MEEKKNGRLSLFWEMYYPIIIGLTAAGGFAVLDIDIKDDLSLVLNAIISFTSVIVGFLGVLLTLIFSLKDNPLVEFILGNEHYKNLVKHYFKFSIVVGFITILLTIIMFLKNTINNLTWYNLDMPFLLNILKILFVFCVVCFMLSSYRLISIIIKIAFIEQGKPDKKDFEENDREIQEKIKKMRDKLALPESEEKIKDNKK